MMGMLLGSRRVEAPEGLVRALSCSMRPPLRPWVLGVEELPAVRRWVLVAGSVTSNWWRSGTCGLRNWRSVRGQWLVAVPVD